MDGRKILIVDDEKDIVDLLAYNFSKHGMDVHTALNGSQAIEQAYSKSPDIVLLDVMLPDIDGIEVCEKIRSNAVLRNTIIVFLSARGEDYSQVAGYRAGADDYVVKPIKPKVLIEKVDALLRRISPDRDEVSGEHLTINSERFSVLQNGHESIIPKKEFELLALLMSVPQKVFRREEILSRVWGDTIIGDRTIDVHIRKLREKFGDEIIQTVKGVGYRFTG